MAQLEAMCSNPDLTQCFETLAAGFETPDCVQQGDDADSNSHKASPANILQRMLAASDGSDAMPQEFLDRKIEEFRQLASTGPHAKQSGDVPSCDVLGLALAACSEDDLAILHTVYSCSAMLPDGGEIGQLANCPVFDGIDGSSDPASHAGAFATLVVVALATLAI